MVEDAMEKSKAFLVEKGSFIWNFLGFTDFWDFLRRWETDLDVEAE